MLARAPADLDLSFPSYRGAYFHARQKALALASAGGRPKPNADDVAAADHYFLRLLYLVEASEGGLLGLSDGAIDEKLALLGRRFTFKMAVAALYEPVVWPVAVTERVAA